MDPDVIVYKELQGARRVGCRHIGVPAGPRTARHETVPVRDAPRQVVGLDDVGDVLAVMAGEGDVPPVLAVVVAEGMRA
jgi:hypothetical protein